MWKYFYLVRLERNGVDLPKIVEAIKVRPTHFNMIFPGPGIGGYCLPKDGGLGVRHDAYKELEPEQIINMIGNPAVIIDCFACSATPRSKPFSPPASKSKAWGAGI